MNIGVFTGNRAEYGLMKPLLQALKVDEKINYKLFVGGSHLNPKYGHGLKKIKQDGFKISALIQTMEPNEKGPNTAEVIGNTILNCCKPFLDENLDGIFIYADRFESFAATVAASQSNIPVYHIEGGDLTEGGTFDDNIRHAMTKLSHLHFPSNCDAYKRIIRGGEERWRVKNVGLLTSILIKSGDYSSITDLKKIISIKLKKNIIIFTQHSITTSLNQTKNEIDESIKALKKIVSKNEISLIITYPNNDLGSDYIIKKIENLAKNFPSKIQIFKSLGRENYHGLLSLNRNKKNVICLGNSSSILKETLDFGVIGIVIGTRQDGRLSGKNIIKTIAEKDNIISSIELGLKKSKKKVNFSNPYFKNNGIESIIKTIKKHRNKNKLILKKIN